jgi:chromosome segregation protein
MDNDLDDLLQRQAEAKSRREVLNQLVETKEGFSAGAQTILTQFDSAIGALADQIDVPKEYEQAVTAALGLNLQLVITEQPQSANEMLSRLSQDGLGKASIVSLELLRQRGGAIPPSDIPNEAKYILDIIKTEEHIQPLIQTLLGHTLIVEDLNIAIRMWESNPGRFDYVTHRGESLSQQGVSQAGKGKVRNTTLSSLVATKLNN